MGTLPPVEWRGDRETGRAQAQRVHSAGARLPNAQLGRGPAWTPDTAGNKTTNRPSRTSGGAVTDTTSSLVPGTFKRQGHEGLQGGRAQTGGKEGTFRSICNRSDLNTTCPQHRARPRRAPTRRASFQALPQLRPYQQVKTSKMSRKKERKLQYDM